MMDSTFDFFILDLEAYLELNQTSKSELFWK